MERTLYKSLIKWKIKEDRKPLILNGARQVGKTYLINEFARNEYKKFAFFSLDRQPLVREVFEHRGDMMFRRYDTHRDSHQDRDQDRA